MANVEIYTKETCPYCHRANAAVAPRFPRFLLTHSTLAAVMTCMHWMHVVDWIPC